MNNKEMTDQEIALKIAGAYYNENPLRLRITNLCKKLCCCWKRKPKKTTKDQTRATRSMDIPSLSIGDLQSQNPALEQKHRHKFNSIPLQFQRDLTEGEKAFEFALENRHREEQETAWKLQRQWDKNLEESKKNFERKQTIRQKQESYHRRRGKQSALDTLRQMMDGEVVSVQKKKKSETRKVEQNNTKEERKSTNRYEKEVDKHDKNSSEMGIRTSSLNSIFTHSNSKYNIKVKKIESRENNQPVFVKEEDILKEKDEEHLGSNWVEEEEKQSWN